MPAAVAQIVTACPTHIVLLLQPVILQTSGVVLAVIILLQTLVQPPEFVIVTVYVPTLLMVIHWVVAPVLQR